MWGRTVHCIFLITFVRAISSNSPNIIKVWESRKEFSRQEDWDRDFRQCEIKEICPEDSKNCEDKVKWKNVGQRIKKSAEVVVMDDRTFRQASFNHTLTQRDLDDLKDHLCDMAMIKRKAKGGCLILWIPNQCPWEPFTEEACPFSKKWDI